MLYSKNFGLLAALSMILFVARLSGASTSSLEFSLRDADHKTGPKREIGPGKLGAVATENAICSRHGIEMFEMGGNAADAVSAPYSRYNGKGRLECRSRANRLDS